MPVDNSHRTTRRKKVTIPNDPDVQLLLATLVGFAGTACGMLWPVFRSRTGMLAAQTGAGTCFALHFLMIGAHTGAFMNLLAALQAAAAIPLGEDRRFRLVYLALLPVIFGGLLATWNGVPSLMAALATAVLSLARYQRAVVPFRALMAVALPCWFAHNYLVGSIPAMISDISGMTINGAMLISSLRARATA